MQFVLLVLTVLPEGSVLSSFYLLAFLGGILSLGVLLKHLESFFGFYVITQWLLFLSH